MTEGVLGAAPRTVRGLLADTFRLYRRYPLLFFVLAAVVIVPYQAIVLVVSGGDPGDQASALVGLTFTAADLALITPLVSALHIHAVAMAMRGEEPALGPIARQGLRALPPVVAVSLIYWLGVVVGFAVLIAPGVYLMLRWVVAVQAAAVDRGSWLNALRASSSLSEGHYWHVFAFIVLAGLIVAAPSTIVLLAFGGGEVGWAPHLLSLLIYVLGASFAALATALLYFDLRARLDAEPPAPAPVPVPAVAHGIRVPPVPTPGEVSWDPRAYPDEERPQGWYVDPSSPEKMRYWPGVGLDWEGSSRTPRKIRQAWWARVHGG